MKVLAIDQSYTSTGIVLFEDGAFKNAELYKTDPEKDVYERVWDLTLHIISLVLDHKPDVIALEGLAFSKFGNATRDLAGLQYTLVVTLRHTFKHKVVIIPPNTVKKNATGKGNAKKPEMYEVLPEGVKQYFKDMGAKKTKGLFDLTDAYWIGKSVDDTR
jgi:Holliday junction resolvasome RuvABC endonuclease subunit